MPLGIVLYIGPVVIEKFDLNVALARLVQKIVFVRPQIRVVALDVGITAGAWNPNLESINSWLVGSLTDAG